MEMWWLASYVNRLRLALLLAISLVVLVKLSYYVGFERTFSLTEDVMDALAAFAVAVVITMVVLSSINVIRPGMPPSEIIGKLAIQAVPASIGAVLARRQLGGGSREPEGSRSAYAGQLFLMGVGALFFSFNVAPTQEIVLLASRMTYLHAVAVASLSVLLLHSFVYTIGFAGQEEPSGGGGMMLAFLHYTCAGYGIVLLVSIYVLWTFGRTDGASMADIIGMTVVLGLPAAVGAAVARLVL